jgi:hypothetical protein
MSTVADSAESQTAKVFLCHGSGDKPAMRELYQRPHDDGMQPWLDEVDLIPGQRWETEIRKAVRESDVVMVCLSERSASKEGFVQKEIRFALDRADEKRAFTCAARLPFGWGRRPARRPPTRSPLRSKNDPDTEVKEKAVFALQQLPDGEGVPMLIQYARTNRNPAVRKQAFFWLG